MAAASGVAPDVVTGGRHDDVEGADTDADTDATIATIATYRDRAVVTDSVDDALATVTTACRIAANVVTDERAQDTDGTDTDTEADATVATVATERNACAVAAASNDLAEATIATETVVASDIVTGNRGEDADGTDTDTDRDGTTIASVAASTNTGTFTGTTDGLCTATVAALAVVTTNVVTRDRGEDADGTDTDTDANEATVATVATEPDRVALTIPGRRRAAFAADAVVGADEVTRRDQADTDTKREQAGTVAAVAADGNATAVDRDLAIVTEDIRGGVDAHAQQAAARREELALGLAVVLVVVVVHRLVSIRFELVELSDERLQGTGLNAGRPIVK
ncbi:MAG: hypothetical protein ACRDZO_26255 [Egibacteraceae bacterium]